MKTYRIEKKQVQRVTKTHSNPPKTHTCYYYYLSGISSSAYQQPTERLEGEEQNPLFFNR
jgi:hypothetical protein